MSTNILRNDVPRESVARWSPLDGRAIVETSDGKVYSFDLSRPSGKRFQEERSGFHSGMWLQPALAAQMGKPIETDPAGEYPFADLEGQIEFRLRINDAILFFLESLDPENGITLRKASARKATLLLDEKEVCDVVEPALLDQPMPDEFDTTHGPTEGRAGQILRAMITKWRS